MFASGTYWNNHHHMLHATHGVTWGTLWANLQLLFYVSLIPFATGWMDENHIAAAPMALYGVVFLLSAIAYWILQANVVRVHGKRNPRFVCGRRHSSSVMTELCNGFDFPLAFV